MYFIICYLPLVFVFCVGNCRDIFVYFQGYKENQLRGYFSIYLKGYRYFPVYFKGYGILIAPYTSLISCTDDTNMYRGLTTICMLLFSCLYVNMYCQMLTNEIIVKYILRLIIYNQCIQNTIRVSGCFEP